MSKMSELHIEMAQERCPEMDGQFIAWCDEQDNLLSSTTMEMVIYDAAIAANRGLLSIKRLEDELKWQQ